MKIKCSPELALEHYRFVADGERLEALVACLELNPVAEDYGREEVERLKEIAIDTKARSVREWDEMWGFEPTAADESD